MSVAQAGIKKYFIPACKNQRYYAESTWASVIRYTGFLYSRIFCATEQNYLGGQLLKTRLVKGAAILGLGALALTACGTSEEGAYPDDNIELIVPFGPGGGASNFMQQLAPIASEELGVNIRVDHIEGVGGVIGMRQLAEADNDGYTIGTYNPPATNIAQLAEGEGAGVDLYEDLTPIAIYGIGGWVMIVPADSEVEDLNDVVDQYDSGVWTNLGGEHVGGPTHLIAEMMKENDGLAFENYVGFEGGEASAAVMRNEVPAAIITDSAALAAVESGDVKVVGVLYEPGSEFYPDVPTAVDQGFSDLTDISRLTRILWAPEGTDQEKIDVLADAFQVAVEDERSRQWSEDTGSPLYFGDADEAQEALDNAYEVLENMPNLNEIIGSN